MVKISISLAQIDVHLGDPDANLTAASDAVREAGQRGSNLVLLPELWSSGYDLPNWSDYACPLDEGGFEMMSRLACDNHIWVGGSCLESASLRAYNTFALFDDHGRLQNSYRKVHLFRLMEEDRWLAPGDRAVIIDTPWTKFGLAVCYDLRFPELFRRYALDGVDVILLCAAWPSARIAHWNTLLKARAIENQLFIAGVNRSGETMMETFGGHSAVVDPWGEPLCEAGEQPGLVSCEIDLSQVNIVREKIPVLFDRRPDVYD